MMQENHVNMLALLRSALWGQEAHLSSSVDWSGILKLASAQTVLGLVGDAVCRLQENELPPQDKMLRLRSMRVANINAHTMLNAKLAEVLDLMHHNGLEPILLKGQGLAAEYADPTSRQCGDIDLYIGKEHYSKACGLAVTAYGRHDHDSESIKHYHLCSDGVHIELHRIAESMPGYFVDRRFQKWTYDNLHVTGPEYVEVEGVPVPVPPVSFNPIYILNHAWHHFMNGGIGMRQVCDWAVYLHRHHSRIDVVRLKKDLRSMRLLSVWHMFAFIAVNHLGLPADECPLYEGKMASRAEKVLEIILEEGNFGRHSSRKTTPRPEGYAAGKLHSFRNSTARYSRLFAVMPVRAVECYAGYVAKGIWYYFKGLR